MCERTEVGTGPVSRLKTYASTSISTVAFCSRSGKTRFCGAGSKHGRLFTRESSQEILGLFLLREENFTGKMLNGLAGDASTAVTRELDSGVGQRAPIRKLSFISPSVARSQPLLAQDVQWCGDRSGSVIRLS
jgi:hypothetical protein